MKVQLTIKNDAIDRRHINMVRKDLLKRIKEAKSILDKSEKALSEVEVIAKEYQTAESRHADEEELAKILKRLDKWDVTFSYNI